MGLRFCVILMPPLGVRSATMSYLGVRDLLALSGESVPRTTFTGLSSALAGLGFAPVVPGCGVPTVDVLPVPKLTGSPSAGISCFCEPPGLPGPLPRPLVSKNGAPTETVL